MVFAFCFLAAQLTAAAALLAQGVAAAGNPHGSAYYVFMGIHAAHLTGGLIWLAVLYWTSRRLYTATENDLRRHRRKAQAAAIYWHYMGLLWLVLFTFLHRWTE
jgi:heme/copper-type cytochrome/quinol oxidase subunit 3